LVATSSGSFDFTATGHVVALTLGVLLSTRFRLQGSHWTPLRLMLLASAVAFGYDALIGLSVAGTPIAGLAAALIALVARSAVHRWSSRELSRSVAPQDHSGALAV
jgi:hypothetical protein